MRMTAAVITLLCLALGGCGSDPYRGAYEAVKSRNESTQSPTERSMTPAPSYDSYQKEREQQR